MSYLDVICLANSRKYQGHCVAGIRADGQGWIRPVGNGDFGALAHDECRLDDGSAPQPLDLIRIDVAEPLPEPYQPENWLIGGRRWQLLDRPAPRYCAELIRPRVERGPALLGDESDRIPVDVMLSNDNRASLSLVLPKLLQWHIIEIRGKRQTRAAFRLGEAQYDLPVTDLLWERRLSALPVGLHPIELAGLCERDKVMLTISLGEPFHDNCYKLIAAVTVIPQGWLKKPDINGRLA